MKHLALPNGSYIHPAIVEKIDIASHLCPGKFYVRIFCHGGRHEEVKNLGWETAKRVKAVLDHEIRASHLESSAYEDGYQVRAQEQCRTCRADLVDAEQHGEERILSHLRERLAAFELEQTYPLTRQGRKIVRAQIKFLREVLDEFRDPAPNDPD